MTSRSLVWWVDRCFGARIVPAKLRDGGIKIRTYAELYPDDPAVPDAVWIPEVTARGWVILTKDKEIRRNPEEIAAIRRASARYVCLSAKGMSGEQQADCLLGHWRTLEGVVDTRKPPLLVTVTRADVRWLDGTDWRVAKARRAR